MLEDKGIRLGRIEDPFMQLGINKVNKEGVRKKDGQQVVRVIRVKIWTVGKDLGSGKETV